MTGSTPIGLLAAEISSISASRFGAVKRCPLAEAALIGEQAALIPQTPRASLGTAIHNRFARAVTAESFNGSEDGLSEEWEKTVKEAEKSISASPFMTGMLPLRKSIPNLGLIRSRTLLRLSESCEPRTTQPFAGQKRRSKRLSNQSNTVVGIPDKIEQTNAGAVIIDFKTGVAGAANPFSQDYHAQLKLYAALYKIDRNEWPVRLELHWLDGTQEQITFTPHECEELLFKAERLAQNLRGLTRGISHNVSQQIKAARPSANACRFCPFRPACPAYVATAQSGDPLLECDVSGGFLSARLFGNGEYLIELEGAAGKIRVRNVKPIDHIVRALSSAISGKPMIVFNVNPGGGENLFSPTSFTAVHIYDLKGQ